MAQPSLNQPSQNPVAPPKQSLIGTMARGAAGLGTAGAILGGVAGAGALALGAVIPGAESLVANAVSNLPVLDALTVVTPAAGGAAATTTIGAGGAALAGLATGAIGGAALGAPAGAVSAPIYAKQRQTEAAIPVIAQQAMQHGYQMGEQHGRAAGQELEQESTKFRDMVAQQRSGAQGQSAGPTV